MAPLAGSLLTDADHIGLLLHDPLYGPVRELPLRGQLLYREVLFECYFQWCLQAFRASVAAALRAVWENAT